jgi:hypothetical protein
MFGHYDDEFDHLATPAEAVREWARNFGHDHPDQAWLLSDRDTWERNPFYQGPPVEHPGRFGPGFRTPSWTSLTKSFRAAFFNHTGGFGPLLFGGLHHGSFGNSDEERLDSEQSLDCED